MSSPDARFDVLHVHRLVEAELVLHPFDVLSRDGRVQRVDRERAARREMHQREADHRHAEQQQQRLADAVAQVAGHQPARSAPGVAHRPRAGVPRVDRRVQDRLRSRARILHTDHQFVGEDRRERHVVKQDFLDAIVDRLALGLLQHGRSLGAQRVDLGVLVLHVVRSAAALGRDQVAGDAVRVVGSDTARVPADHQRVELALHRIVAPHDRGRHVLDRHLDVDLLEVLLNKLLRLLARLVAGGGGHGEGQSHAVLGSHAVRPYLPAHRIQHRGCLGGVVAGVLEIAVVRPVVRLQMLSVGCGTP